MLHTQTENESLYTRLGQQKLIIPRLTTAGNDNMITVSPVTGCRKLLDIQLEKKKARKSLDYDQIHY